MTDYDEANKKDSRVSSDGIESIAPDIEQTLREEQQAREEEARKEANK